MRSSQTKKMVQGAMIAAIFGVLSLFNTYTGSFFDIFICYGMVVPLVWYGYHYDLKDNMMVCFVSMIVIAMMGVPFFVISALSSCFAGLFIGEALKRKAKKGTIMLGTVVVTFINNILIYEVFSGFLGVNLIGELTESYQMLVDVFPQFASYMSMDIVLSFIPLLMLIVSVLEMYVIILLCQLILARLKIEFPGSFHIATMHLSLRTGNILLLMVIVGNLGQHYFPIHRTYFMYLFFIGYMGLALQGVSFLCFYLIIKRKPMWTALAFLSLFIPVINSIVAVIGYVDIFNSDLRKKILYNSNR